MNIENLFNTPRISADFYAFPEDLAYLDEAIKEINDTRKFEKIGRSTVINFFLPRIIEEINKLKNYYEDNFYQKDDESGKRAAIDLIYQTELKKKGLIKEKFKAHMTNEEVFTDFQYEAADLSQMLDRKIGVSALIVCYIRPMADALKEYFKDGCEHEHEGRWNGLSIENFQQELNKKENYG